MKAFKNWLEFTGISEGPLFRPVSRRDKVVGAHARPAEEPAANAVDAAKLPVQKTEASAKNAVEEAKEASQAANKAVEAAKD